MEFNLDKFPIFSCIRQAVQWCYRMLKDQLGMIGASPATQGAANQRLLEEVEYS